MLPSSKNILENVLNSKFSFKLTANCKALILLGNDLVCAGLENGEICIFSATKFQFISNYQALDGPIIHIEHLDLKEDFFSANEEEKAGSERRSPFVVMIQGKEGDVAFIRYIQDSKSFETILKWKESTVVGFTKVTVNNQVWQSKIDSPTPSFLPVPKIFETLDQVRLFYPDNDSQNLESYRLQTDTLKKEELFIPPAKGAKEINICCLKYLSFEEHGIKSEFILSAEENSRIGMISLSPTKFSSSKFKEICQMEKKGYAYCIEPYQLVKEDENLTLKLLIGLNIEEALVISINMTTLKVASTNMIALSPSLKPGLNNAIAFRDGKYILVSTSDFKIKICRTKDFKPVVSLSVHENYINDILIANVSEDKEYLFSCSENYDFCILDLSSLKKAQ